MEKWSVSQSTYIDIDFSIFDMWLDGRRYGDIMRCSKDGMTGPMKDLFREVADDVISSHVGEQLSLYLFLKSFLEQPGNFLVLEHQLASPDRQKLINSYYWFQEDFAREVLNHRLSSKLRKDVEDIAFKHGLAEHACLRYFDNFRNVLNKFEDCDTVPIVDFVKSTFGMSEDLSKKYASIVFLQHFKLDISKRKMQFLNFNALCGLSLVVMKYWTCDNADEASDFLDREFLNRMYECKSVDSDSVSSLAELLLTKLNATPGTAGES